MAHPNEDLLRRAWAAYDRSDVEGFAACLTPDWRESDPSGQYGGIDDERQTMDLHRTAFPDKRTDIHRMVANDDFVACHCTTRATHQGTYLGLEPTGKEVKVEEMMFCRVRDGRLQETWVIEASPTGFYEQITGRPYDGGGHSLDNMG
jgi:predicted ester cyclase